MPGSNRYQRLAARSVLVASVCALSFRSSASLPDTTATATPFGVDLHGKALHRLAPEGTRAVVLFFAASDCPISNRYAPEITHLRELYRPQGVEILSIYPNPTDTASVVTKHDRDFAVSSGTVLDPTQSLTHLAHARLTPEAAILIFASGQWHEVYLGRIDDRYLSLGTERPGATRHDLEEAIRAVLEHRPVPPPGGPAVGCAIMTPAHA